MLPSLGLTEPIVTAMVKLLKTNLPAVVTELNATITDGYTIDEPVQYLPYVPVPSTLQGGMPAIGVQRMAAQFQNDIIVNVDAAHRYAVVAIVQNVDQQALAWQLDRTLQAITYTIQNDRVHLPAGGIMQQAGVWNLKLESTEPGPLLGDLDPFNPESPPRSYLSWVALVMSSERTEV